MRKLLLQLPFILLVPLILVGCPNNKTVTNTPTDSTSVANITQNWADYTSGDQSYSVKFPGQPQEQTQNQPSAVGNLTLVLVLYEDTVNKRAYLTNHVKYPVDPKQYDVEKGLELAKEGAIASTNAELLSETQITKNNFPGREFVSQTSEGLKQKHQVFIDPNGPTLYQIILVAEDGNVDFPEANAFFESFVINK